MKQTILLLGLCNFSSRLFHVKLVVLIVTIFCVYPNYYVKSIKLLGLFLVTFFIKRVDVITMLW